MASRKLKNYYGRSSVALRCAQWFMWLLHNVRFARISLRQNQAFVWLSRSLRAAFLASPTLGFGITLLGSISLRRNQPQAAGCHAQPSIQRCPSECCASARLRGRAAARGFTLIELLAAISILAIVAVLSWRGLDTIIRTRTALTSTLEQTRGMQLAFAQMQSDCGQIASTDEIGRRQTLLAETGRLILVRTVFIENQPSRVQVVAYRLQGGVLSRYESEGTRDLRALDALWSAAVSDAGVGAPVVLQSGVTGMDLRLWSESSGWYTVEDIPRLMAAAALMAPTGLEVTLRLAGNENGLVKVMLLGAI